MAASDRGLQSVPRGLDRNLTTYLQAIRTELLRLSALSAVRTSPAPYGLRKHPRRLRRVRFHAFRKRGCGRHRLTDISGRFRH